MKTFYAWEIEPTEINGVKHTLHFTTAPSGVPADKTAWAFEAPDDFAELSVEEETKIALAGKQS